MVLKVELDIRSVLLDYLENFDSLSSDLGRHNVSLYFRWLARPLFNRAELFQLSRLPKQTIDSIVKRCAKVMLGLLADA